MAEGVFDWHSASGRRSLLLYAAGAVLGLGLAGFALFTAKGTVSNTLAPENLALVNGRQILRSDFITQTQVETGVPFKDTTLAQRMKVVNEMIDEELLVQRGLEVDLAAYDPEVRAAMVAGVNLQIDADVLASQPKDEDLKVYFTQHPDRYAVSGIMKLVDLVAPITATQTDAQALEKAKAASAALMAGMSPDAAIAGFGMMDTKLVDKEDNFDFGVRARLGPVLYAQAEKLDPGQASPATRVADEVHTTGYHVVVMIGRVKPKPVSFEQVKDNVFADFNHEARNKIERSNLDYLRGQADIRLAPEYAK